MKAYEIPNFLNKRLHLLSWDKTIYIYYNLTIGNWSYNDHKEVPSKILNALLIDANWEEFKEQTKEEIFFEQVKGKKIRWSDWPKEEWFIPLFLIGGTLEGQFSSSSIRSTFVNNGFEEGGYRGGKWEFYREPGYVHEFLYVEEECHSMGRHWDNKVKYGKVETSLPFRYYKQSNPLIKIVQEIKVNKVKEET